MITRLLSPISSIVRRQKQLDTPVNRVDNVAAMSYYALVLGLVALFRNDAIFTAIIAVLIFWHIATWTRVTRRGNAFVSLLIDSASLMMYAGTFLYSRLVPEAFTVKAGNPATALTGIALLGLISALIGFGFGLGGRHKT